MIDPALYQLAIEQTKDYALFLLDPEGRILTWNAGAERLKGYTPDEIIGRHFSIFYTQDSIATGWPQHELKVATIEGRFEDEGWRLRKDGSRFWASVIITALRDTDGHLLGFSKITRDVTSRKMHEEALAQSEERFRLLIEGVVDYAIYMLDPEGIITSWNSGASRIKGYTADEIIGKHFSRFFTPEDVRAGAPWAELAEAKRSGHSETEGWRVKKNGERFWARAVVSALHDAQGRLRGYAKVTQDLSERRHAQELERAARNLSEFIAVLAHELRNPLAPIKTAVNVIEATQPGTPAREEMYKVIARQATQLARIVDDMLDISRVTRGEMQIERKPVDLADVVNQAVETAAPAIEAAKHSLEVKLADEALVVEGDARRLAQLAANLLNNAARYTPQGGRISVSTSVEDRCALLTVADTGRGIPPEWRERIFDMFVQARPALERVEGGLGIGLALSRKIAQLHGGSLTVHSAGENKGSEFTLRVPLRVSPAQAYDPYAAQGRIDVPPRRVLIVDDNDDAAVTLQLLLTSLGHQTSVARNGLEALERAPEFRPDVVLLDIGLPGLDGYEVARRLRAQDTQRMVRLVAVTGWGQPADRAKSQEAGFDLHLVKPVGPEDLEKALAAPAGAAVH
ncbi:MAG TPA: PAS domain S-box protein [Burkholderiales bacterium]|nr:PAS domain S-box protein [Burkholderiales bacterium]